jgi:hypothetical protein
MRKIESLLIWFKDQKNSTNDQKPIMPEGMQKTKTCLNFIKNHFIVCTLKVLIKFRVNK